MQHHGLRGWRHSEAEHLPPLPGRGDSISRARCSGFGAAGIRTILYALNEPSSSRPGTGLFFSAAGKLSTMCWVAAASPRLLSSGSKARIPRFAACLVYERIESRPCSRVHSPTPPVRHPSPQRAASRSPVVRANCPSSGRDIIPPSTVFFCRSLPFPPDPVFNGTLCRYSWQRIALAFSASAARGAYRPSRTKNAPRGHPERCPDEVTDG